MRRKILIVLILFLGVFHLKAQSNPATSISDKEVQLFSEIYQHKLDNPFDVVTMMKKNAKDIAISEKRMSEILQAQFAGNTIELTPAETIELSKFQSLMATDEAQYTKKINAFVRSKQLSPVRYAALEKEFERSITLRERVRNQVRKN